MIIVNLEKHCTLFAMRFIGNISSRTLTFHKKMCYLLHGKPFKNDRKFFLFHLKSCFCSQYILRFFHDFLVIQKKRLDQKDKVNFKMHDVKGCLTKNCNTHIANILGSKSNQAMKLGQLIDYKKRNIFFSKIMQKMRQGD